MALALFVILLIGTAAGAFFVVHSWNRRRFREGVLILRWGLGIWAAYLAVLVVVSLAAPETEAAGGEVRFCGVDPDCTLSASVVETGYAKTLGNPPNELIAGDMFYLVTVRVLGLAPDRPRAPTLVGVVVDGKGREFRQSANGERAYRLQPGRTGPLQVMRGSWRTTMVFDLPGDIEKPALVLREGSELERLFELFLIGDEASLLHPKTKLRLLKHGEG